MLRCAITWRGSIALDAADAAGLDSARVLATLAKLDATPSWERRTAVRPEAAARPSERPARRCRRRRASSRGRPPSSSRSSTRWSSRPRAREKRRLPKRVTPNLPIVNETGLVRVDDALAGEAAGGCHRRHREGDVSPRRRRRAHARARSRTPPSGDVPYDEDEGAAEPPLRERLRRLQARRRRDARRSRLPVRRRRSGVSNVELRLGNLRRRLAVFGDRKWGGFGFEGKPARFEKMPLRWERALGGPALGGEPRGPRLQDRRPRAEPRAPRGAGALEGRSPGPRVLRARPATLAGARVEDAGRYDAAWLKERWPYLPADFDWGHFNAAPPEQQVPYLRGDERFVDRRRAARAARASKGSSPGARPRVFAQRTEEVGGDFFEVLLRLDTAWFDTDASKVVLVWRGLYSTPDDDSPDIAALFVDVRAGRGRAPARGGRASVSWRASRAAERPAASRRWRSRASRSKRRGPSLRSRHRRPRRPRAEVLAMLAAGRSLARRGSHRRRPRTASTSPAPTSPGAILAAART